MTSCSRPRFGEPTPCQSKASSTTIPFGATPVLSRFRELLLNHVELLAIIGLPEKAFVHTDCGVHGALLFFERRRNPRSEYKVFVGRAVSLGYDRLGKPTRESDLQIGRA